MTPVLTRMYRLGRDDPEHAVPREQQPYYLFASVVNVKFSMLHVVTSFVYTSRNSKRNTES